MPRPQGPDHRAARRAAVRWAVRSSGGAVVPESFTHGTSAQRTRWFNNGLQNGSVKGCDTFSAKNL